MKKLGGVKSAYTPRKGLWLTLCAPAWFATRIDLQEAGMARIRVVVAGGDAILQTGVAAQLRSRPNILVLDEEDARSADVAVVIGETLDEPCRRLVRSLERNECLPVVLVVTDVDDAALMAAVEMGVCGVLRRRETTPEGLESAVKTAAKGDGAMAPDLLRRLMVQTTRLQRHVLAPLGFGPSGISDRELDVLRLLAEGFDTAEIAGKMSYSERTIKSIIHALTVRLNLKNRLHAVAYATKAGLI
jgi:DNA-binding NarL/FixJ family response regulator